MNPSDALARGHLLRDFPLPGEAGTVAEFRRRSVLVLVFGEAGELAPLLDGLEARWGDFRQHDAKLLVVLRGRAAVRIPYLVDDGRVAAALKAQNGGVEPRWAVLATDRFGEIFLAAVDGSLPSVVELLRTAEFVEMQCEECHPPEWPVL